MDKQVANITKIQLKFIPFMLAVLIFDVASRFVYPYAYHWVLYDLFGLVAGWLLLGKYTRKAGREWLAAVRVLYRMIRMEFRRQP